MRNGWVCAIAAVLAGAIARPARTKGARGVVPGETRWAPMEAILRMDASPGATASAGSLWGGSLAAQCRVPALYAAELGAARFGELMRMAVQAAPVAARAAKAAAWAGPGVLQLAAANDADVASRFAVVEPGATPVVRLIKAGSIRPRRATFGAEVAQAA